MLLKKLEEPHLRFALFVSISIVSAVKSSANLKVGWWGRSGHRSNGENEIYQAASHLIAVYDSYSTRCQSVKTLLCALGGRQYRVSLSDMTEGVVVLWFFQVR
jgi:hypothetical protein